jgi:spermidine synthase
VNDAPRTSVDEGRVPAWLLVAFFVSGAAGLVYEVVWAKVLSYTLGNSLFAISTVVAAFFGGLAIGAYLLGPPLARAGAHVRRYALLEVGVAVLGILSVPALRAIDPLFLAIHRSLGPSFPVFLAIRFLVLSLLLLVPTALMGATLPLLVAHAEGRRFGGALSRLYAANTFGAVAGTLGAALVLIPAFGLFGSALFAAACNLAAGVLAWMRRGEDAQTMSERRAELAILEESDVRRVELAAAESAVAPAEPATAQSHASRAETSGPASAPAPVFLLSLIALSGFAALLLEVSWTRVLTLVIGSSVISFAMVLAFYLLGIAAGSALIASRLARLERPLAIFAYLEIGLALVVLTHLFLFPLIPGFFLKIMLEPRMNLPLYLLSQALLIGALIVPPCLFLGALFPLSARLLYSRDAGRATGLTYAVNTAGTILGSLATGFLLIPSIGSRTTIIAGSLLSLVVGLAALARSAIDPRRRLRIGAGAVAAAIVIILVSPAWDLRVLTAGIFRPAAAGAIAGLTDPKRSPQERLAEAFAVDSVVYYREGVNATVSLNRTVATGDLFLKIGGKTDASSGDIETQLLSGHLPMLFAPDSARVMVIGQGSGMTLGGVLRYPVKSAEIVEIEDAVIEASRWFHPPEQDPLDDPRTRITLEDGRTRLAIEEGFFDVIISEPSNPWLAGNNNLFTRDFYRLVRSRLSPEGVFGQWIQLYEISPETLSSLLTAFRSVFPNTYGFLTFNADFILIAAPENAPFRYDKLYTPEVVNDLRRVRLDPPELVLSYYMCELDELPASLVNGVANTDDNARVEYRAPIDLFQVGRRDIFGGQIASLAEMIPRSPTIPFAKDLDPRKVTLWRAEGLARRNRFGWAREAAGWLSENEMAAATADSLKRVIDLLEIEARSAAVTTDVMRMVRSGRVTEAEQALREGVARTPNDEVLLFNLGIFLMQSQREAEADSFFALTVEHGKGVPVIRALNNRGIIAMRHANSDGAIAFFRSARALRPDLPDSYFYEAKVLHGFGRRGEALALIEQGLALNPDNQMLLKARTDISAAPQASTQ